VLLHGGDWFVFRHVPIHRCQAFSHVRRLRFDCSSSRASVCLREMFVCSVREVPAASREVRRSQPLWRAGRGNLPKGP
jgi:hypothetical protein